MTTNTNPPWAIRATYANKVSSTRTDVCGRYVAPRGPLARAKRAEIAAQRAQERSEDTRHVLALGNDITAPGSLILFCQFQRDRSGPMTYGAPSMPEGRWHYTAGRIDTAHRMIGGMLEHVRAPMRRSHRLYARRMIAHNRALLRDDAIANRTA